MKISTVIDELRWIRNNYAAGNTTEINNRIDRLISDLSTEEPPKCEHEWLEGFDMAGPTRRCVKCGKFERD